MVESLNFRIIVGILGLQGAFEKHASVLKRLNVNAKNVRYPEDLEDCNALIIPGGESTTISKLIDFIGLRKNLIDFAESRPIFGTCAGMIMMATIIKDPRIKPLGLIDIEVERNGFGRQVDSFTHLLETRTNGSVVSFTGVFIRAPRITKIGSDVEVLASLNDEPVFVRQGIHLATSFHPELSKSTIVHEMLISYIRNSIHAI